MLAEEQWFTTELDELKETAELRAEQLRAMRRSGNSVCLVARESGAVVGMVQLEGGQLRRVRHVARLELMVARTARGRGVGEALMRAALSWARRSPALEKVELAVYAHNAAARALYARLGFLEEGVRRGQQKMPSGERADEVWLAIWL